MNVSYKGVQQNLPAKVQAKVDTKFAKLSKLLEQRGEREAHVIVREQRGNMYAEVTIRFYDHQLVAEGKGADLFTALSIALEKLEQQAVKQRDKWREKHRRQAPLPIDGKMAPPPAKATKAVSPRVYRITQELRKPITLEEAVLMMDRKRLYMVYRDSSSERVSVLIRRADGHFDLIES